MPRPFASPDPLTAELEEAPLREEELPPRPRRRLATRWTVATSVVILLALGFIGGVLVQRGQQPAAAAGSQAAAGAGAGAGAGQGFGAGRTGQGGGTGDGGGAAPVAGKVSSVDGRTLYVTTNDGTTVKVRASSSAKVTRTAKSSVGAVHPGDTVVITGSTAASGTVTAADIIATANGVMPGGFGGGGRFGGQQGGAAPGSGG